MECTYAQHYIDNYEGYSIFSIFYTASTFKRPNGIGFGFTSPNQLNLCVALKIYILKLQRACFFLKFESRNRQNFIKKIV